MDASVAFGPLTILTCRLYGVLFFCFQFWMFRQRKQSMARKKQKQLQESLQSVQICLSLLEKTKVELCKKSGGQNGPGLIYLPKIKHYSEFFEVQQVILKEFNF
ncbi:uncharacterized protein LOC110865485 isoform X2 [Helianthus annuus]|uniref:uncharacterized protein LOC110865485 isoform X2 n=1 Tax=Helianthus annuus TaxID=4232 RepID=UPI0016531A8C|nr:uncharacterized protein LOC110865485 isoform X2 [Helianthus annuus]